MSKSNQSPQNLAEAIQKLENASESKAQDLKQVLEKDYHELMKAIEDIKPHLQSLKQTVETEVQQKKNEVESKVKESPWIAMGIVGLFAFVIGLLIGKSRK